MERPVFNIPQRSPLLGLSMFGGVSSERLADDFADLGQARRRSRAYPAASFCDHCEISWAAFLASA